MMREKPACLLGLERVKEHVEVTVSLRAGRVIRFKQPPGPERQHTLSSYTLHLALGVAPSRIFLTNRSVWTKEKEGRQRWQRVAAKSLSSSWILALRWLPVL